MHEIKRVDVKDEIKSVGYFVWFWGVEKLLKIPKHKSGRNWSDKNKALLISREQHWPSYRQMADWEISVTSKTDN